tara:strand:+ start:511 stop:693 length:183 start_codon:yes stop_codon:yes gene_type:complete
MIEYIEGYLGKAVYSTSMTLLVVSAAYALWLKKETPSQEGEDITDQFNQLDLNSNTIDSI